MSGQLRIMRNYKDVDSCPKEYTSISLCSGYGGIELGIREAVRTRTLCYVEIGVEVCEILVNLMDQELLDEAPIWSDLTKFPVDLFRGRVDILTGGFPCQPFSFAGQRLGVDDKRNLWPYVSRIIREVGPPVIFLENVPGILRYYFDTIRPELRKMGYVVEEGLFSAQAQSNAPQKRQRLFILAYSPGTRIQRRGIPQHLRDYLGELAHSRRYWGDMDWLNTEDSSKGVTCCEPTSQGGSLADSKGKHVRQANCKGVKGEALTIHPSGIGDRGFHGEELADSDSERLQGRDKCGDSARERTSWPDSPELVRLPLYPPGPNDTRGWEWAYSRWPQFSPTYCKDRHNMQPDLPEVETGVHRVADGALSGVDKRLRAVGNGVVPAVAAFAFVELARGRIL